MEMYQRPTPTCMPKRSSSFISATHRMVAEQMGSLNSTNTTSSTIGQFNLSLSSSKPTPGQLLWMTSQQQKSQEEYLWKQMRFQMHASQISKCMTLIHCKLSWAPSPPSSPESKAETKESLKSPKYKKDKLISKTNSSASSTNTKRNRWLHNLKSNE